MLGTVPKWFTILHCLSSNIDIICPIVQIRQVIFPTFRDLINSWDSNTGKISPKLSLQITDIRSSDTGSISPFKNWIHFPDVRTEHWTHACTFKYHFYVNKLEALSGWRIRVWGVSTSSARNLPWKASVQKFPHHINMADGQEKTNTARSPGNPQLPWLINWISSWWYCVEKAEPDQEEKSQEDTEKYVISAWVQELTFAEYGSIHTGTYLVIQ